MDWIVLTYRLPAEPSRHRVAVWRELRKVGAVSLQQATWALPARHDFVEAASRAVGLIEQGEGDALVFDAVPRGQGMEARLEELFTAAELDEEDQNLERLRRWFRDLRRRDVFVAASQHSAEQRLKECAELLEDFAERVYEHGGGK